MNVFSLKVKKVSLQWSGSVHWWLYNGESVYFYHFVTYLADWLFSILGSEISVLSQQTPTKNITMKTIDRKLQNTGRGCFWGPHMTEYELEKNKSIYYIKYYFERSYVDFGQCWLSKNPQKISHQKGLLKSFSTHQKSSKSDYGARRYPKKPESVFFL